MTIKSQECWECYAIGGEDQFYKLTRRNQIEYYCPNCIESVKVEG